MHELKFLHELGLYGSEFLILRNIFVPAFFKGITSRKTNNKYIEIENKHYF